MWRRLFTTFAICWMTLPPSSSSAGQPAEPGGRVRRATLVEIRRWLMGRQRTVLTFLGYSGAEYEAPAVMLAEAAAVLAAQDPARVLVNLGATPDGIGSVYGLAKQHGFETMGIVSTRALEDGAKWSPAVDHVFLIEDRTWGGAGASGGLGPTSAAMVAVSDEMVAIGGGEIARDELLAARRAGKRTRFIPAESNHGMGRLKAQQARQPGPTSFASALGPTAWVFP